MKRYNIQGYGNVFWVQERIFFWWVDIHHGTWSSGATYRREYPTLDDAYAAVAEYRKESAAARAKAPWWMRWLWK